MHLMVTRENKIWKKKLCLPCSFITCWDHYDFPFVKKKKWPGSHWKIPHIQAECFLWHFVLGDQSWPQAPYQHIKVSPENTGMFPPTGEICCDPCDELRLSEYTSCGRKNTLKGRLSTRAGRASAYAAASLLIQILKSQAWNELCQYWLADCPLKMPECKTPGLRRDTLRIR